MAREITTAELSASDDPILEAIYGERQRVTRWLEAYRKSLDEAGIYGRLMTIINAGTDPEEERRRDPAERGFFVDFGDDGRQ